RGHRVTEQIQLVCASGFMRDKNLLTGAGPDRRRISAGREREPRGTAGCHISDPDGAVCPTRAGITHTHEARAIWSDARKTERVGLTDLANQFAFRSQPAQPAHRSRRRRHEHHRPGLRYRKRLARLVRTHIYRWRDEQRLADAERAPIGVEALRNKGVFSHVEQAAVVVPRLHKTRYD